MQDAIVEKLWRVVDCRDQSLGAVHGSLAKQALEKESEIHKMTKALTERENEIVTKENEIVMLTSTLSHREEEIMKKEAEIRRLALAASERLELINQQCDELETVRRSSEYRLGYAVLNPWQVLKKRLFGDTSVR